MADRRLYAGPVEALPLEEVCARLRIGLDLFNREYDGPRVRIGSTVRISAADLAEWLDRRSRPSEGTEWESIGEQAGPLPSRKPRSAA